MNASAHRTRKHADRTVSLPIACGYALLVFLCAATLLLFIAAVVTYSQKDPGKFSVPASLCALYLSAGVGGIAAGRLSDKSLMAGGIFSVCCTLLTLFLSVLPLGTATCGFGIFPSVLARVGIAAAALLGAWIFKKKPQRPPSRHSKRRR